MILWQWEQGRGEYFRFENILMMSRVLLEMESMHVSDLDADAKLRARMRSVAGLEFLPRKSGYSVWRNYARVFKAAMLAVDVPAPNGKKKLMCTNLCRRLAAGKISAATDYVVHLMRKFYLDGPVFNAKHYRPTGGRIFPFCAFVRLLAATTARTGEMHCVSPDEAKDFLFARQVSGTEDMDFYQTLPRSPIRWKNDDQRRQVREMFIFAAQCSFLKWDGQKLCIDLPEHSVIPRAKSLFNLLSPSAQRREPTAHDEIMNLGGGENARAHVVLPAETNVIVAHDPLAEIGMSAEGRRRVVNHVIIERSPKLRKMFFARSQKAVCDMTGAPRHAGFPWVENILEIHHVNPLSSSISSTDDGTRLDDLVALTPTSHRAVHDYYRRWMRENRRDFRNKEEAWSVYLSAKSEYARARKY